MFLCVMLLLAGLVVTLVGFFAKPFWGPEDDWCDFCREERLTAERNLKNCRIVGPVLLALGVLFVVRRRCVRNNERASSADVENQQTSATGTASAATLSTEMTSVTIYPPPPFIVTADNTSQPPALMPTAPYPTYPGEMAYPPNAPRFSFPTAVDPDVPPPSYESAVAGDISSKPPVA